eukprot:jgi/Psemu1/287673/fgenesh1_pg.208_\
MLTERELRRGTTIAGSFLGIIVGITILPNLWLVGMILGSFYGYELTKPVAEGDENEDEDENDRREPNAVGKVLVSCGSRLAKAYLQLKDYLNGLWFLYKTGQLSYEYYKTYENLDQKFAIQNKIDAWNRVFVEGKQKFDAWEQENEVGRTVLAGLRTAWLVDEQSRKRAASRSKYRLVQIAYDAKNSVGRFLKRAVSSVQLQLQSLFGGAGGENGYGDNEFRSFFKGLRIDLALASREGSIATRFGAVVGAIAAVNLFGAVFSLSPVFSSVLVAAIAVVWPSWAADLASRTREVAIQIKSRGKKQKQKRRGTTSAEVGTWGNFKRR